MSSCKESKVENILSIEERKFLIDSLDSTLKNITRYFENLKKENGTLAENMEFINSVYSSGDTSVIVKVTYTINDKENIIIPKSDTTFYQNNGLIDVQKQLRNLIADSHGLEKELIYWLEQKKLNEKLIRKTQTLLESINREKRHDIKYKLTDEARRSIKEINAIKYKKLFKIKEKELSKNGKIRREELTTRTKEIFNNRDSLDNIESKKYNIELYVDTLNIAKNKEHLKRELIVRKKKLHENKKRIEETLSVIKKNKLKIKALQQELKNLKIKFKDVSNKTSPTSNKWFITFAQNKKRTRIGDFAPGEYHAYNAAGVGIQVTVLDSFFVATWHSWTRWFLKRNAIAITAEGSADAIPITGCLEYDGYYGTFPGKRFGFTIDNYRSYIDYVNQGDINFILDSADCIDNRELAFLRSYGFLERFLNKTTTLQSSSINRTLKFVSRHQTINTGPNYRAATLELEFK